MATKIVTKNSSTAGAAPTATDLVQGELAVNVADGRLYTEDNAAAIVELGVNPATEITANAGIALPDSQKATFGAGDDLQIYHDGGNSYIDDVGTGDLVIRGSSAVYLQKYAGENMLKATADAGVQVFYNNAEKLATTSTGIDVTGTATMDGLTVETATGTATPTPSQITIATLSAGGNWSETDPWGRLAFYSADTSAGGAKEEATLDVVAAQTAGGVSDFFVKTYNSGLKNRIKVGYEGNVSFYEDTGTTAKFFWDASAESLGIGTSAPSQALEIAGSVRIDNGASFAAYEIYRDNILYGSVGGGSNQFTLQASNSKSINLFDDSGVGLTVKDGGNVGIGTSSPDTLLEIVGADPILTIRDTETAGASTNATLRLAESGASDTLNDYWDINYTGLGALAFKTKYGASLTEAMRIDSSGRVGIGTSSPVSELDVAGITPTLTIKDTQNKSWTSSDTTLGELAFRISDASGIGAHNVAFVRAVNDITSSSTPSGALSFGVAPNNSNASEAMRIDSSGNVGIGTSSPLGQLHINTESAEATKVYVDGEANQQKSIEIRHYDTSEGSGAGRNLFYLKTPASGRLDIGNFTDGSAETQLMTFLESGKVGIGRTPTSHILETAGEIKLASLGANQGIDAFNTSSVQWGIKSTSASDAGVAFEVGNTERMRIDSSGNVGIGTSSPSYKADILATNQYALRLNTTDADGCFLAIQTNGTAKGYLGTSHHLVAGTPSENDITLRAENNLQFTTGGGSERMRIDSSGRVGIGTTSPNKTLEVANAAGGATVSISTDQAAGSIVSKKYMNLDFTGYNNNVMARVQSWDESSSTGNGYLTFHTTPAGGSVTERMRIDASGNLLVGTGTSRTGTNSLSLEASNSLAYFRAANAQSLSQIIFVRNTNGSATTAGSINTTGTSTSYNTSSDYRLKEDDVAMTGATERVKALRPVNFAWKADGSRVDGFFAHELAEVVPEATTGTKDAMMDEEYEVTAAIEEVRDEDGNITTEAVEAVMGTRSVPDMQGVDQSKLVPLLTATIQELIARIEALENGE